jgi:hypothetical protein
MLALKISAFIFLIPGIIMVFGAKYFVKRLGLQKNMKCDFENEMTVEELEKYKYDRAVVNFKMYGMLVLLPGIIILLIAFR